MIKFAAICPHPAILIPSVGSRIEAEKTRETIKSMGMLAKIFAKAQPDVVIVISPHGPIEYQKITINMSADLFADFARYGDYKTILQFDNDLEIARLLTEEAGKRGISTRLQENPIIDHGVSVPLALLTQGYQKKVSVVPIYYSLPDNQINFDFGKVIHEICQKQKKNIAIIASGDLSHRLTFDAPLGFNLEGPEFDKQLIQALDANDTEAIQNIDKKMIREAKECGYLSIIMLLGVIEKINENRMIGKAKFESLSYQGPSGTGYLVGYYKF